MNLSNAETIIILIALTLATSGCMSFMNGEDTEPGDVEVDRTVEIKGGNIWFEIEDEREDLELEFEEGKTVEFIYENQEGAHDLRIPGLNAGTQIIGEGETESFTVTFDEQGEYEFICSVGNHADLGQRGLITVT